MHAVLGFLQEVANSSSVPPPPSFSIFELGKALFTLSFFTLVTLICTGRAAWRLKAGAADRVDAPSTIDLCLFWGAFTFGVGVFHTLMGLVVTSWSVQLGAPIEPGEQWLVAHGVMTALVAGAYGLLVFLLTALGWLGLRRWYRRVAPAGASSA